MSPKQSYSCNEETLNTRGQMETSMSTWMRKWEHAAASHVTRKADDQRLIWRTNLRAVDLSGCQ